MTRGVRTCLAVLFVLWASVASADTILDTGFQDPVLGASYDAVWFGSTSLATANVGSGSFTLTSDALLNGITIWTYDTVDGSAAYLKEIAYDISGSSGVVTSGMGQIVAVQDLMDHRTWGPDSNLFTIQTTFTLASQVMLSAATYTLAIRAYTDPSGVSNNARWAVSGDGEGRAMSLDGVSVPEPSTLILLLIGAVSIVHRRRYPETGRAWR